MNLTKLFNFKFMKQMLKKAKGQIILLLSIIPIFTFLILMMSNTGSYYEILDLTDISVLNLIGMYVIPVILSINLFNYIYKSPSVDFINSMPINKKTIFASNTLLGIILIVLMQLINVLGILLFTMFKTNVIILPEIIFDSFIISVIGYIFVFTATNLAMCLSGNIITQIAVTCLIVFLVPFTVNMCNDNLFSIRTGKDVLALDYNTNLKTYEYENSEYNLDYENENILPLTKINEFNETMPYRYIKVAVSSNGNTIYDSTSNLKTLILAVIYVGIGVVLFEKRRFENVGDSFRSTKTHEFVKALTMFPMIAFINSIEIFDQDIEIILFVYALLLVYFFVYDIITNKKQRFKISILYILIIFIFLNVITLGIEKMIANKDIRRYCLEDVESISINLDGLREYNTEILTNLKHELIILPQKIEKILAHKENIQSCAKKFSNSKDFIFIARGINFPTALEGALKLKEISYINATGYTAGELKHGPIAMLDESMPVLSILMKGGVYEKILSNSEEAKARNARMIALTNSNDENLKDLFECIIQVPEIDEMLSPALAIVPLQLLAYYIAEFLGKDVDQPRNLAKSVTVD